MRVPPPSPVQPPRDLSDAYREARAAAQAEPDFDRADALATLADDYRLRIAAGETTEIPF